MIFSLTLYLSLPGAQAVLAALYARQAGHCAGQHIKLAMLDTGLAFNWIDVHSNFHFFMQEETVETAEEGEMSGRVLTQRTTTIPESFGVHQTSDGHVTFLGLVASQNKWTAFASNLAPALLEDSRFSLPRDR